MENPPVIQTSPNSEKEKNEQQKNWELLEKVAKKGSLPSIGAVLLWLFVLNPKHGDVVINKFEHLYDKYFHTTEIVENPETEKKGTEIKDASNEEENTTGVEEKDTDTKQVAGKEESTKSSDNSETSELTSNSNLNEVDSKQTNQSINEHNALKLAETKLYEE